MSGGADVRYGIVFGEKAGVQDRVDILHAVLLRGTTVALAVRAGPPRAAAAARSPMKADETVRSVTLSTWSGAFSPSSSHYSILQKKSPEAIVHAGNIIYFEMSEQNRNRQALNR